MPKKVSILVEGQTEEAFVKKILVPFFAAKEIFIYPTIIKTKRVVKGPDNKGGVNSYHQVKRDLTLLFSDTSIDLFTTMIDYYALPIDFPGYDSRPNGNCYQRIEYLEDKFKEDINKEIFYPYLQLHEFEALVFANNSEFESVFISQSAQIRRVEKICQSFTSPEEINEDPRTAPSKRLLNIFPEYDKVLHSQLILGDADLAALRNRCPHFNRWLEKIES